MSSTPGRETPPAAFLIHGGLWEEMDAGRFWHRPGISSGLTDAGIEVTAPDRPLHPESWAEEARQLTAVLPEQAVIIAGSNGCSAAVRIAIDAPDRVRRLILAWPATAGDPVVDARTRDRLIGQGAAEPVADALLGGSTLRGVDDAELVALTVPVALLPSVPENRQHQRRTVDALLRLLPHAVEVAGSPEPPRPGFTPHRDRLVASLIGLIS